METIIIDNPKDLKKHQDKYWVHIQWNCEINYNLWIEELPKRLLVDWYLLIKTGGSIKTGGFVKVGRFIRATGYIKACGYIEAGWYIESGGSIESGGYIESGGSIKTGGSYWLSAWLSITCKWELNVWLKVFAGICTWKSIEDDDKTITCLKLVNWTIGYGILKETWVGETHTIELDWKEIKISKESYEEFKKQIIK